MNFSWFSSLYLFETRMKFENLDYVSSQIRIRRGLIAESNAGGANSDINSSVTNEMKFRKACVEAKLDFAAFLLSTTGLDIPDIAATIGYSERGKFESSFT